MGHAQLSAFPAHGFHAVDAGDYRAVIDWYGSQAVRAPAGREALVLALEAAVYLCRASEAERLLAETADVAGDPGAPGDAGRLARRREALELEHRLDAGRPAGIAERLERLLAAAKAAEDAATEARARHLFARLAFLEGDWIACLARGKELTDLAAATRNAFTLGRALLHRGNALRELSRPDEAGVTLRDALRHLEATENLRYRALAELALAGVCLATGRVADACDLLEHSEATLVALGIDAEALLAREAFAWALFAAGRTGEARGKALAMVETGLPAAEALGRRVLACVAAASGDAAEAARAAAGLALASPAEQDTALPTEGGLLAARARAAAGAPEAAAELETMAEEALARDMPRLAALARIYHAEALLFHDPVEAEAALAAASPAEPQTDPWVVAELAALERSRARQPIRVEGGVVTVNLNGELPLRERVQGVLDRALIRAALERTNGNYAKAGRLIGEKRWNMRFISIQKAGAPKHKTPRRAAAAMMKTKPKPGE